MSTVKAPMPLGPQRSAITPFWTVPEATTLPAGSLTVTVTVKDPAGNVVASGTVQDGVIALRWGPNGIGAFTVDIENPTAAQVPVDLWEVVEGR